MKSPTMNDTVARLQREAEDAAGLEPLPEFPEATTTASRTIRVSESDIPLHGWAPYAEVHRERLRAHAKHSASGESIEQLPADHPIWLAVLGEEYGEVCNAIIEHNKDAADIRAELVQVAAVACAWIEALDAEAPR